MRRANAVIRRSLSTAALVTLAALAGPTRARAQNAPPVVLDWSAPAGCPTASEVLTRIRKLAHAWAPAGTPLRAEATITRTNEDQLHLRLIVHASGLVGERNIDAKACANLASATAIHVALLLNQSTPLRERDLSSPDHTTTTTTTAENATGETARSTAAAGTAEPPTTESESHRDESAPHPEPPGEQTYAEHSRTYRVLVQVPLASLRLGPLPRPSFGVSLAAGVRIGLWRFLADGRVALQQRLQLEDQPEFGADVDQVDFGVRACRALARNDFELAPCLRISVEHVWARGTGAHVAPQTAEATWLAFGVGVQARLYLLDWLSLVAAADAQLEASHPRIFIEGVGSLGKLGAAAVAFTLGFEWIF